MSRLSETFARLRQDNRKALIPFITAGDPNPEWTVPTLHAMVGAGADIIELGIPFSDPMADGPVIQRASERALTHDVSIRQAINMVAEFRQQDTLTPIVLMGYLNPIECIGYETFAEAAQTAGIDGVITVDMPPEEADDLIAAFSQTALDPVFLLAPNSTEQRIKKISAKTGGYLYYVALKGVTGASNIDLLEVENKLKQIRSLSDWPITVGFGIKDASTASAIARIADGVVVGSAIVNLIETMIEQPDQARKSIVELLESMRTAMDASI